MSLPIGTIISWNDNTIPLGWAVCDGDNGTPDLRGKFVYGAKTDGDLREVGGSENHYHSNPNTNSKSAHDHDSPTHTSIGSGAGEGAHVAGDPNNTAASQWHTHGGHIATDPSGEHSHTIGNTGSASHIPPHIKRIFIKRIA